MAGRFRDQCQKLRQDVVPLSTAQPTDEDLRSTEKLKTTLQAHGWPLTKRDSYHRIGPIVLVEYFLNIWIESSFKNSTQKSKCKVLAYGAPCFGIHQEGAVIQAVCIAPVQVSRNAFFSLFFNYLKTNFLVSNVVAMPEAVIPIIKMTVENIPVELSFAQLPVEEVSETTNLSDEQFMESMDPTSSRSLGDYVVTEQIMEIVSSRLECFQLSLSAILLWCKVHGIDYNDESYLGVVFIALLVARTIQLYPNACASTIVEKFYGIFHWLLPKPLPEGSVRSSIPIAVDRRQIISTTSSVTRNEKATPARLQSYIHMVVQLLKNGRDVIRDINAGNATWNDLFQPKNFIAKYGQFISYRVESHSAAEQAKVCAFVEAEVRSVVLGVDKYKGAPLAYLWPKTFEILPREGGGDLHTTTYMVGWIPDKRATTKSIRKGPKLQNLKDVLEEAIKANETWSDICFDSWYSLSWEVQNFVSLSLSTENLNHGADRKRERSDEDSEDVKCAQRRRL